MLAQSPCDYSSYDDYAFSDASLEWAHDQINEIDMFYSTKILDENLRFIFIKGLSNGFINEDPTMKNELEKCEFDWIHYYYMQDDFEKIEELYQQYIDDQKIAYYR